MAEGNSSGSRPRTPRPSPFLRKSVDALSAWGYRRDLPIENPSALASRWVGEPFSRFADQLFSGWGPGGNLWPISRLAHGTAPPVPFPLVVRAPFLRGAGFCCPRQTRDQP